ncbi:MAG: maltose ABC transporter substrate-binding protein [Oscillospiraceae bacterium]
MRNLKKTTSALLASALALSLCMTGCVKKPGSTPAPESNPTSGTSSTPASPEDSLTGELSGKLTVWVGDTQLAVFEKIAKDFSDDTGMEVELVPYTGLSATDKLALDGPAGKGGDVYVQGGGGGLGKAAEQGLFMAIPEGIFNTEDFTKSTIDDYTYKGQLYGMPMGAETAALMYNKALISEIPETFEELIEVCNKNVDFKADKYGFLMDTTNPYFTMSFFDANGGYVFGQKDGVYDVSDIGLNTQGVKDTMRVFVDYYNKGYFMKNMAFDVMEKKFGEGKAPVIFDGPWAVSNFVGQGIDVGVAPIPKLANGNYPRTYSGVYGVSISEYTKNQRASVEFVKYCVREESIMEYYRATKRIPPLKACLESDEVKNDPIVKGFSDQLEHSMPQPNVPEMDAMWGPMIDAATLIITQGLDVDTTMDKAVEKFKEQINIMTK